MPGVFTEGFQFYAPEEIDHEYTLGDGKLMVNVGSVGQPRDGDNRACYIVLEDGTSAAQAIEHELPAEDQPTVTLPAISPMKISYRRLPYDFETTIKKIYAIPDLDPFLGDRLRQGR